LVIALLKDNREHPLNDTWTTISKLCDTLNTDLKEFRDQQRSIHPHLKLSALDVDEPEVTAVQLPSYLSKRGRHLATGANATELKAQEIQIRCAQADEGILAVQAASLALTAVKKARELDYRGQGGKTRSEQNLEKANLMKMHEITMYNTAHVALVALGHMEEDADSPYRFLTVRDTRRKETHLHRVRGDSRLFDGTAWYLQSGETISHSAVSAATSSCLGLGSSSDEDGPQLLLGTQMLKRTGEHMPHSLGRLNR
jgi:hypothetical protein